MATITQRFATEDLEYVRHGHRSVMLRLFRPAGAGRFPPSSCCIPADGRMAI